MLTLNTTFYDDDQWGQFIDIESQQLFPKQIIYYESIIKTETKTITTLTTTPPLKSILKKPIQIQTKVPNESQPKQIQIKNPQPIEENNNHFNEFVERQLYIGWAICVLTFGFYLIP